MEKMEADDAQEDVKESEDVHSTESVEGDALEFDESAYIMYHRAQTGVSKLAMVLIVSFDYSLEMNRMF